MAIPLYFAMTAAEISSCTAFPTHVAWMACHFSSSGKGLSNLPETLSAGSMLILDDSFPPNGHDPALVSKQLHEVAHSLQCDCILLDFQRPQHKETTALVSQIIRDPPCPVGISSAYAHPHLPVLLPPVPLDTPIDDYIFPWKSQEIWLEIAPDATRFRVDPQRCTKTSLLCSKTGPWWDEALTCHYSTDLHHDYIDFTLSRSGHAIQRLLEKAEALGIAKTVALWQELQESAK